MFLRPIEELVERLVVELRKWAEGCCSKVTISLSGGVDSSVVVALAVLSFGPEKVVGVFRDIKSKSEHYQDVVLLRDILKFSLIRIDANKIYDLFLQQCESEFEKNGLMWISEDDRELTGFKGSYASLKSRFTTPFAGFISKAIDGGRGMILGTGNGEEDGLLRYFDKYGDGAVDNNILNGLTKCEVRQLALYFAKLFQADIFIKIAKKIPSADLHGVGDLHNDESELTSWAKGMGFDIQLSYGDCEREGNIAWAWKEDLDNGIITGWRKDVPDHQLSHYLGYKKEEVNLILFLRTMEAKTRHKENPALPGLSRTVLRQEGYVD